MQTVRISNTARLGRAAAAIAIVAVAAACGGDATDADDAAPNDGSSAPVSTTEDRTTDGGATDDLGAVASSAADVLEDAGVDPNASGSAELVFMDRSYDLTAAESFGCFLTEDGGSQGAVDFDGTADDGTEFTVSWAGDSPDTATASLTTSEGAEWTTPFTDVDFDVSISGSSATVEGGLVRLEDGGQADFTVDVTCG